MKSKQKLILGKKGMGIKDLSQVAKIIVILSLIIPIVILFLRQIK